MELLPQILIKRCNVIYMLLHFYWMSRELFPDFMESAEIISHDRSTERIRDSNLN